ncbi:MAG: transglycosylase SLT domain-containing protein [Solirubrobacterales bacterium]
MRRPGQYLTLVTALAGAGGTTATAALALQGQIEIDEGALLIEVTSQRPRPATLVASAWAKELQGSIAARGPAIELRSRGALCVATVPDDASAVESVLQLIDALDGQVRLAVALPPDRYRELIDSPDFRADQVLFRFDPTEQEGLRALSELALREAGDFAGAVELVPEAPGRFASRRLLAGRKSARARAGLRKQASLAGESGQATPLVLGAVFVLVLTTVALAAIAGAITGKARAQSVADLSALSSARSMKNDLPRLLAPPVLPNGAPNPAHMSKFEYLMRARLTATRIAVQNGASPIRVSVRFPDSISYAPVRTIVTIRSRVESGGPAGATSDWAEARVGAPVSMGSVPTVATGGGYSGPLSERQGKGMRPDVAVAFDRMSAAAAAAGVTLSITSAFRSDAEQAALFAANPDPTWVARPGTSLHRCATELDLGPSTAYGWLAANATRFGFTKRYSWEAWHFGFVAGPAPCSGAGNRVQTTGGPESASAAALPAFVPARYRKPILASAMKWGVSAALLAAQLYAESNFDPNAGSPAGAQGIAQFMPGTAAAYGLGDPFDPVAAIDAQGHLMSDLLDQFGSPALALAAYNAGPGAVSPCNCIPDYPETQAYVARILALLGGVGAIEPMPMEVELVR